MSTFLVNAVISYLTSPQGPARLNGYLRGAGVDVTLLNTNHDTYSYLFSRGGLERTLGRIRSTFYTPLCRNRSFRQSVGDILIAASDGEIRTMLEAGGDRIDRENAAFALLDQAPRVVEAVSAAQERMDRNLLRQSPESFWTDFRTLLCGKAIVDVAHFPAQIDFGLGFQEAEWGPQAAEIARGVRDERHNYLLPYYRTEVVPVLEKAGARVVGISMSHFSEMVPVFTLASEIKRVLPEAHVVLGGTCVTLLRDRIAANDELWQACDSLVYGPGEVALLELVSALESRKPLSSVPNLIYKDGDRRRHSDRTVDPHPDEFATPEFVNLRPGAMLGLETSVGCYWGKCGFCYYPQFGTSGSDHARAQVRERSLEKVEADLAELVRKHDPAMVLLTDSAVSPRRLAAITRFNRESGHRVGLIALARLEKQFGSASFCRDLADGGLVGVLVGLEAGSERVNRLINKGTDHARHPEILATLHESGILTHLYAVVGYPGETEDEAHQTCRFIEEHRQHLGLDWELYPLYVIEHGPMARDPERHGLELIRLPDSVLLPACLYRRTSSMTSEQIQRLVRLFEDRLAPLRDPVSSCMDPQLSQFFLAYRQAYRWRAGDRGRAPSGPGA